MKLLSRTVTILGIACIIGGPASCLYRPLPPEDGRNSETETGFFDAGRRSILLVGGGIFAVCLGDYLRGRAARRK